MPNVERLLLPHVKDKRYVAFMCSPYQIRAIKMCHVSSRQPLVGGCAGGEDCGENDFGRPDEGVHRPSEEKLILGTAESTLFDWNGFFLHFFVGLNILRVIPHPSYLMTQNTAKNGLSSWTRKHKIPLSLLHACTQLLAIKHDRWWRSKCVWRGCVNLLNGKGDIKNSAE